MKMTYPMKWSKDKATSYTNFERCYKDKLKPNNLFASGLSEELKRFFEVVTDDSKQVQNN